MPEVPCQHRPDHFADCYQISLSSTFITCLSKVKLAWVESRPYCTVKDVNVDMGAQREGEGGYHDRLMSNAGVQEDTINSVTRWRMWKEKKKHFIIEYRKHCVYLNILSTLHAIFKCRGAWAIFMYLFTNIFILGRPITVICILPWRPVKIDKIMAHV